MQGGAFVSRGELVARSAYTEREPNKYGEISKKVIGVFNQLKAGVEVVLTRLNRWRLVRKQG
ncbi:hypothetical protein INT80_00105 [Gallibacterium anatis]|uniref:Uncharacterized protein n=1 Tax=Gallibacterium anatis TaxID=750 RepID=A0A930UV31_9PAST|nr:hypothetical protein [Gallibacterium anatis]